MTALCGGGASQAKPGFQQNVVISTAGLGALLTKVPTPWAVAFAMLLAGVSYDLLALCSADPPALVVMTAADMFAIATPLADPIATATAIQKFYTFIKYWAWFEFCECSAIATPAPAAPPAAPAGLPQLNPPIGANPVTVCVDKSATVTTANGVYVDMSDTLLTPGTPVTGLPAGGTGITRGYPVPTSDNSRINYVCTLNAAAAMQVDLVAVQWTSALAFIGAGAVGGVIAGDTKRVYLTGGLAANAAYWALAYLQRAAGAGQVISCELIEFCTAPNGPAPAPCCPPDPIATGMLQQLLTTVTLLQRQLVPFAYITGTAHAGLSGNGTIAVQGLLGLRIDLTTVPAGIETQASTPPFIFNVGWVSLQDANGFIDETRAHATHQNWFSRIASEATLIGYSFPPGVVATITELQREP